MTTRRKFVPRPDHVRLGTRTYDIRWLSEEEWPHEDNGQRGVTKHVTQEIIIRLAPDHEVAKDEQFREVLVHEILHAVSSCSMAWNVWDVINRDVRDDFNQVEEVLVGLWAPWLLGVFKDNPGVMAYLLDDQEH